MTWKEMDNDFSNYVKGKSIAIVGPSETTSGSANGKLIDSFDLIARVKSFLYPESMIVDIGSRTDILYTTSPQDRVDIKEYEKYLHPVTGEETYRLEKFEGFNQYKNVEFVVSTYPEDEWFADRYTSQFEELKESGIVNCRFANSESYFEVKKDTDRPNSGFSAIVDILSFDISSLHIFGIDFHRAMYRSDYRNSLMTHDTVHSFTSGKDGPDSHRPDLQYQHFKYKLWKNDPRIVPDESLMKFLNDDKYDAVYGD